MNFISVLLIALVMVAEIPAETLAGRITDPQNASIARVRIRLYPAGSTQARSTVSGTGGEYRFEAVPAGAYVLEAEHPDFRLLSRNIRVGSGPGAPQDIQLELAGVANSVQVTAEAGAIPFDQVAKAVSTVDGDEIRNRNEFGLSEILRNTPGVQVRNQGGPGQFTQIRIRGLRPDAAQLLIDGVRFRDAATTQGDASSFTAAMQVVNLDRVEVMRGSGGSLYGTQAVGGSINLVTDPGGAPTHGSLQAEGGGLGFLRGRAMLGGGWLKDRLVYSGGFTHINIREGVDGNDPYRSTGGQGFVRYQFSPRVQVSNRYYGSDDFALINTSAATTGIPAANIPNTTIVRARMLPQDQVRVLNQGGRPDYGSATLVPGRDDPDHHRSSLFSSNLLTARVDLDPRTAWRTSWHRLRTDRTFANGPGGIGFQPVGFASVTSPGGAIDTVDTRVSAAFGRYLVSGGYEFERETFNDRQDNNQPGNARLIVDSRIRQNSHSLYFQNQLSLFAERLQLSASGRWQSFQLDTPVFRLQGIRNPYAGVTLASPPRALTGDIAAAYFVASSGTKFRAHAGNSYRAPSLYERFGGGFFGNPATGQASFTPYGDPRLGPDRYNSFDWGLDQYLWNQRVRVSATHFYVRTKQVIIFDFSGLIRPATDPYGRTSGYTMGPGAINRGAELAVEARPMRGTVIQGSYTFVNANSDRDAVITGFYRALNAPRHTASFLVTQQIGKRLDVTFDVFRSGVHYINYFAAGRNRAYEFPAFTKADLAASYKVWIQDSRSLKAVVRIDNVLNRTYYENGVLNPRAWAVAGLTYSF